jgi:hypothetical protein
MHFLSTGVEDSFGRPPLKQKNLSIYQGQKVCCSCCRCYSSAVVALSHPLPMDMPDVCFVGQKLGNPEP